MKSEPEVYSITDLQQEGETIWDSIRNYQARNFLRQMQLGDLAFFYHSNTNAPGIFGLMRVVKTGIVDPTQFEPNSKYYDPKSSPESPRWQTVVVEFVEAFSQPILLSTLKAEFNPEQLILVRTGNRLSVMSVPEVVAKRILAMKTSSPKQC
jgi:predicted RNA-binding protein with PUA-like domain